ncbi:L-threonylcarbamoyladenylate synthase [Geotoga petraea]|uniref:Threonylcarbamoyl-AMP synthase n=1 Tax=Geotoga petraea TaxID=28234 RepID=A0A1G6JV17_9BACT|nr:L-threonylcarbamoyladenylate synthase [Geotoga petraea]SDC22563.1 translation factor SUA5 [Geotoga petraea]
MTKIFNIDTFNIDLKIINEAAEALKNDETVIFPTETVYGLGANGLSVNAVEKIYQAKGRPSDNPLILHIAKLEDILKYTYFPYELFEKVESLVPGPITFVLKKKNVVPDIVTAGRDTVAIRIPAHPVANKIIEFSDLPIAAPSANLSGKPSPTYPDHVIEDMDGRVDYIISSGKLEFGIESTIINLTEKIPTLLRPGPISPEKIKEIFGDIKIPDFVYGKADADIAIAPGMKYRHYAPESNVVIFNDLDINIDKYKENSIFLILKSNEKLAKSKKLNYDIISTDENHYEFAINLFYMLRKYDKKYKNIMVQSIEDKGIGIAIMNRLRKAANKKI